MILEPFPAKVGFGQLEGLQSRAHRAVDDNDAFLQKSFKWMHGEK
jgi:hypothetical protein